MSRTLLATIWLLVTLDCSLMAYRLSLGRSPLLDQRRYRLGRAVLGGCAGQLPLALVTSVALALAHAGGPAVTASFDAAMTRFATAAAVYAATIIGTAALCLVPSVGLRSAASIVVFGPLTLLRPAVVVATVAYAVLPDPQVPLLAVGALVLVPGLLLEPLLSGRVRRRILDRPPFGSTPP